LAPAELGLKTTLKVQVPPIGMTLSEQVSFVTTNSMLESVTTKGATAASFEQASAPSTVTV
jgi:hypothetical protein